RASGPDPAAHRDDAYRRTPRRGRCGTGHRTQYTDPQAGRRRPQANLIPGGHFTVMQLRPRYRAAAIPQPGETPMKITPWTGAGAAVRALALAACSTTPGQADQATPGESGAMATTSTVERAHVNLASASGSLVSGRL